MLIEIDAAQLEWRTVLFLSQDSVGIQEVLDGIDFHSDNQARYKFPEGKAGRDLAKTFIFRAIYKGPAYAYANDPRFMPVSASEKYWQGVIEATYDKYHGLAAWHRDIIQQVNATGQLRNPTGRTYTFTRNDKGVYPEREIVNHPVQGLGAEFMAIARVSAYNRWLVHPLRNKMHFVNTVHDSIVIDANVRDGSSELDDICQLMLQVFLDIPRNFTKLFGVNVNVPLSSECKYGMTMDSLIKYKEK